MLKKLFVLFAMMYAAMAFAAVDANKATAAELDGIKGIGPGISAKIIDERKKGAFKDWNDMITRVNGIGEANAAKFSAEGMTVGGAGYKGVAAAAPAAKKDDKPAAKDAKDSKPAAKAEEKKGDAKADPKAEAKAAKAKAAEEKKAKADAAKKEKAEAKAKKDADSKEAKAKPAAKADAKADAKPVAAKAADAKADAAKPAEAAKK
jgi:competence protein ComEA